MYTEIGSSYVWNNTILETGEKVDSVDAQDLQNSLDYLYDNYEQQCTNEPPTCTENISYDSYTEIPCSDNSSYWSGDAPGCTDTNPCTGDIVTCTSDKSANNVVDANDANNVNDSDDIGDNVVYGNDSYDSSQNSVNSGDDTYDSSDDFIDSYNSGYDSGDNLIDSQNSVDSQDSGYDNYNSVDGQNTVDSQNSVCSYDSSDCSDKVGACSYNSVDSGYQSNNSVDSGYDSFCKAV